MESVTRQEPAGETSPGTDSDQVNADIDGLVADVFSRNCPSRTVLENVAGRWGILAMVALAEGSYRFNALRRRVDGVSEKMLSQTLHALERDGLVIRDVQSTIPPKVEYSLTELGSNVAGHLVDLIGLLEDSIGQVLESRERQDVRTA